MVVPLKLQGRNVHPKYNQSNIQTRIDKELKSKITAKGLMLLKIVWIVRSLYTFQRKQKKKYKG